MSCIFCDIINGKIPSNKLYEDDKILAFKDINPEAPIHFLVVPKIHIKSANEIKEENSGVVSHIFEVIPKIFSELNSSGDYRIVNNCGKKAGQTVNHLHFHVLGGRDMSWPPG